MIDIESVYRQLTGVDLKEQRRLWDERGKGYYGEFCVFKELFFKISGCCKILMNLQVPAANGHTTEIDLVMIHETGIYVFEIKHYKGTIYGKTSEPMWTQYFRTVKNNVFDNPVLQNDYHIQSLSKLFPEAPIYSVVVFSNDNCDLRITTEKLWVHSSEVLITSLKDMLSLVNDRIRRRGKGYDITQINDIFEQLSQYSPLEKERVTTENETIMPFYTYLDLLREETQAMIQKEKQRAANEIRKANYMAEDVRKDAKKKITISIIVAIASVLLGVVITFSVGSVQELKDKEQLNATQENLRVAQEEIKLLNEALTGVRQENEKLQAQVNGTISSNGSFSKNISTVVSATSVRLSTVANGVKLSCGLKIIDEQYGIILNENTEFMVKLSNGTTLRYEMFGERLKYDAYSNRLYGTAYSGKNSGNLVPIVFTGISDKELISSVKLTNISLWKLQTNDNQPIEDGLEFEVYFDGK